MKCWSRSARSVVMAALTSAIPIALGLTVVRAQRPTAPNRETTEWFRGHAVVAGEVLVAFRRSPDLANLRADIDAVPAWDAARGSRNTVVGIVDTGIDYTHPDLAANVWSAPRAFTVMVGGLTITCAAGTHGFNAITRSCDPFDDHFHGSHVAGTIGAVGNNGTGVAGINWFASMMGLKFLSSAGTGTLVDAINAIEFAIQVKAAFPSGA